MFKDLEFRNYSIRTIIRPMNKINYINEELEEHEGVFYFENISAEPFNHFKFDKNWLVLVESVGLRAIIEIDAKMPEEAALKAIVVFIQKVVKKNE